MDINLSLLRWRSGEQPTIARQMLDAKPSQMVEFCRKLTFSEQFLFQELLEHGESGRLEIFNRGAK